MNEAESALYDRLLDQRPARTPFGRKMPEDCFGRFDASEAIIREPLSDIEATTDLAYMHEAYARSFYGHMEQRQPDKAYVA